MAKPPFPLSWPEGWPRTKPSRRTRSRFGHRGQIPFDHARRHLMSELDRLGAVNVVLTSDLPVRLDGMPYATGRSEDPGIAVWFVLSNKHGGHEERVFACDKWLTHAENLHSIALSVEALRGLDRWGASDVVTRAFAGFTALPPGSGTDTEPPQPVRRSWRQVFDIATNLHDIMSNADVLSVVKGRHRLFIKNAHPDAGGSHEAAAELNAALAEAEKELGA